jgi:plastocyanin
MTRLMLALIAPALLAACASQPPERLPEVVRATLDGSGVQHATIVGGSYWFRPQRVIARVNQPLELAVSKQPGIIPHSFVIDAPEAGIKVRLALGSEPRSVRFVPAKPGRYTYYCDESGLGESHRDKGMVGVLEVTAQ